jgi:hypothetical protein
MADEPYKPKQRNPNRMPARGAGWGGPAKGNGAGSDAVPLVPATVQPGCQRDPATGQMLPTLRSMTRQQVEAELQEFYLSVKRDEREPSLNRLAAADKLYDRVFGKPMQTNVNADLNDVAALTDEQLRQRLEQVRRRAGIAAADGIGEPKGSA